MEVSDITCLNTQYSSDGSIKFLWQLADKKLVESIYFTFPDAGQERPFLCISSQDGCNVGCAFCATGQLSRGKTLIGQATAQARKMVQAQSMAPIVDIITLDGNGAGTQIGTLPLFPVIAHEDSEQFFAYVSQLNQWCQEMATFVGTIKRLQNGDQCEEA